MSVSLKQHGGEGKENYKGHKSDMKLVQHGGEGGGKTGSIPGGSGGLGLSPSRNPGDSYKGPGRNLKTS